MNWDSIKLFLALHREGSARAVAAEQNVSPSTVTRKITELEHELGGKLFNRLSSGFQLTETGQNLLHIAMRMEADAYEIERRLLANSGEMNGSIRLTVPGHFIGQPLIGDLALFSDCHKGVDIEILPSFTQFDLSRGEADIALRVMLRDSLPPEELIGTKLVEIYCAVYASREYLDSHDLDDPHTTNWIGWDDENRYPDWVISSPYPHLPVKHHFNDPHMQLYAAKNHMGIVMMPCFMCDPEDDLIRIPSDHCWHRFDLWMLSHPDLRETMRFRELRRFLRERFEHHSALWAGNTAKDTDPKCRLPEL